jgi:hypothetical protein
MSKRVGDGNRALVDTRGFTGFAHRVTAREAWLSFRNAFRTPAA